MTYPLVLTPEELDCLRLMVRTVITVSIHTAAQQHRQHVLSPPPGIEPNLVEGLFVQRIMTLTDSYRSLDLPLFHAAVLSPGKTVVVNLTKDGFDALKDVATKDYTLGPDPDEAAIRFSNRLLTAQPTIRAAFEAAEEQAARAAANIQPNVRPDMSRN